MIPWTSSRADGTTNRADHPGFQSRPVSKISQPIRLSPFTNAITGGRRKQARRKNKQESGGGAIDPEIHEATLRFFRSKRCARNRIIPRAGNKTYGHAVWKKEILLPLGGGTFLGRFSPFYRHASSIRERTLDNCGVDTRSFKGNWMETSLDRILSGAVSTLWAYWSRVPR